MKRKSYANGITRERFTKGVNFSIVTRFVECVRQGSGYWSVTLDMSGTVTLPDGRKLEFSGPRHITAKQHGRKPRKQQVETVTDTTTGDRP